MRFVSGEEIRRVLTFPALIKAMEVSHRRPRMETRDVLMGPEAGHYFVRSATDHGRAFGSKLIASFPGRQPAVQAIYVLFDGATGRPRAVLDGTEITFWKTAADSALGASLLAPADPQTIVMLGAGAMAPWLVRAHRTVRPSIRRVLVWNRTAGRAETVAAALRAEGVAAEATADLPAAVRQAQLISSATRTHTPLIEGAWLARGTHLDLVGGYTPDTREADDEAARRSRVFVDCRESAFDGVGDILGPIASGAISKDDVRGDLYDLIGGGVPGRTGPDDITFFKNAGGGHLDLMTAEVVYTRATGQAAAT